jgi:hypothetical protein
MQCPRCDGNGHEICPQCKGSRRVLQTRTIPAGQPGGGDGTINRQTTITRARAAVASVGGAVVAEQPATVAPQVEVKQTLVPCPTCNGGGGLGCSQCQGIGRLVQRKVFQWRRVARHFTSRDDVPNVDENALRAEVAMTTVYHERASGLKREWAAVPGLRELIKEVERQLSPDTRVVLAEVTVQMIPYTVVELDLGHEDVIVENEASAGQPSDDAVHTVQIYGFENKLRLGSFAIDGERRFLYLLLLLFLVIFVVYTVYVFIVL